MRQPASLLRKRFSQFTSSISSEIKEELSGKLQEFSSHTDNLEEVFENREQIEISKFYERQPKPTGIAIEEFMEDKLFWRFSEDEDTK